MIQLIVNYEDDTVFRIVLGGLKHQFAVVTEMVDTYLVLLEVDEVDALEDALKQPPLKMDYVGTYNVDGTQYVWTDPQTIQRNHSINKYKNTLNDIVEYDENGEEINRRRPTESEALNTQVNKIAGYNDRIL